MVPSLTSFGDFMLNQTFPHLYLDEETAVHAVCRLLMKSNGGVFALAIQTLQQSGQLPVQVSNSFIQIGCFAIIRGDYGRFDHHSILMEDLGFASHTPFYQSWRDVVSVFDLGAMHEWNTDPLNLSGTQTETEQLLVDNILELDRSLVADGWAGVPV